MWRKSLGFHTCLKSAKLAKKCFQWLNNFLTFPKNTVNGVSSSSLNPGDRGVELIQQSSSQHRYQQQQQLGLSLACTWPHTSCCQGTCHCITSQPAPAQGWPFSPQCNLYTHYHTQPGTGQIDLMTKGTRNGGLWIQWMAQYWQQPFNSQMFSSWQCALRTS